MSKKSSLKINYLLNTINQLITIIVPLVTAPYLSRVLTSEGIGIQSYTNSIVTYFTLVAVMGSSSFGQRQIAYDRDNRHKMSESFWNIVGFRIVTTGITLIAYLLFVTSVQQYKIYFIILATQILNVTIDITWFFQGIEDFGKIVTRGILVRVTHAIAIILFVREPDDLWIYIALTCGFNALGYLVMWWYVPRYTERPTNIHPFKNAKDIFLLFLPTIATQLYTVFDKSMIGWITNSTYQNGCYEQAEKIAKISLTVVTSISTVVLPRIANLFRNNEMEKARAILYEGFRFMFLISIPMTFGLISIADTFVPFFFGEGYEMAIPLLKIFSFIIIPVCSAHMIGYAYLVPTGQQNVYTNSVTAAAIINLGINLMTIPRIGAIGAAIGSVVAEMLGVTIQLSYCIARKQLSAKGVFRGVFGYVVAAFIMGVCVRWESLLLPKNLIALTLQIMTGLVVYFGTLILIRDAFVCKYINRLLILREKRK